MQLLEIVDNKSPESVKLDKNKLVSIPDNLSISIPTCYHMIDTKRGNEFDRKGFYLTSVYDWHLGVDSCGSTVLVATTKSK